MLASPDFTSTGSTGAGYPSRYAGATASGAPTFGGFSVGDFVIDRTGVIWICTTAGIPGDVDERSRAVRLHAGRRDRVAGLAHRLGTGAALTRQLAAPALGRLFPSLGGQRHGSATLTEPRPAMYIRSDLDVLPVGGTAIERSRWGTSNAGCMRRRPWCPARRRCPRGHVLVARLLRCPPGGDFTVGGYSTTMTHSGADQRRLPCGCFHVLTYN